MDPKHGGPIVYRDIWNEMAYRKYTLEWSPSYGLERSWTLFDCTSSTHSDSSGYISGKSAPNPRANIRHALYPAHSIHEWIDSTRFSSGHVRLLGDKRNTFIDSKRYRS